jgi:cytosine/adenosine deaminase-related metal-dependent hydrolase
MKAMGIKSEGISENSIADITFLSFEKSHWWPQNDPLSNVIFSSSSSDVTDLIVNGRIVYLNGEHQILDKHKIIEKCSFIADKILTEMGK